MDVLREPRQWQPLVTRAAVAMEICTAMMNQPCQGKHLPDNIYFMIFHSRGNSEQKTKKMTRKGKNCEKRNSESQEIETETEGRDQTVSYRTINQSRCIKQHCEAIREGK